MKTYYDLVLEGPEEIIKGFVEGFLEGRGLAGEAVVIPEAQIEKRPGLGQILKLIHLKESESHLVAEERLLAAITEAVKAETGKLAIKVVSCAQIISASFEFTLKAFSRQTAEEITRALKNIPDNLKLEYSKWEEEIRPDAAEKEAYAPEHEYELHASGTARGNPAHIFALHERVESIEMIEAGPIRLHHGKTVLPV